MRYASYRKAVSWIALNDDSGAKDALDAHSVANYISTALVADLFGVDSLKVAKDIVKYRAKQSGVNEPCQCGRTDKHCFTESVGLYDTLSGFTNTCDCGADYNMSGQMLAPRSQWGEETGETADDILSI